MFLEYFIIFVFHGVHFQDEPEPINTNHQARKLPKWMAAPTPSPVVKQTTTTPKSSYSRSSSYTAPTSAKRHCKLPFFFNTNFENPIFFPL